MNTTDSVPIFIDVIRWGLTLLIGSFGLFLIGANWTIIWIACVQKKHTGSMIPLIGGLAAAIALLVIPIGSLSARLRLVWIPLLSDYSILMLILLPVWMPIALWKQKRAIGDTTPQDEPPPSDA